jgi:hypothetical protein
MKSSRHGRPLALAEIKFAEKATLLKNKSHKEVFTYINESNMWGAADSRSGLGSELDATTSIRAEIPKLLNDLKIKTLLDLPCGDFGWMSKTDLPIQTYIGGDIVESVISELSNNFQEERNGVSYSFCSLDLVSDDLPKVDLVFCRDCMVHFSYESIAKALSNLKRSGSTYLVTTTFTDLQKNIDVQDGDWRPLNLQAAPFLFCTPEKIINEQCTEVDGAYSDKSLGLWKIRGLPMPTI